MADRGAKAGVKWWRWGRRGLLGLVLLAGLFAVAVEGVLLSLEKPLVKSRVLALLREQAGLELDYGATQISLTSRLRIDNLVLRDPLVRIGTLEAEWSIRSLLGAGPKLQKLSLRDVAVTLDAEPAPSPTPPLPPSTPPLPPTPLSKRLAQALEGAALVENLRLEQVAVTYLMGPRDKPRERWQVTLGGTLQAAVDSVDRAPRLQVQAGASAAPLAISIEHERDGIPAGSAALQLALSTTAVTRAADMTLELRVMRQTLGPALAVARLMHVGARFEPAADRSRVTLNCDDLADGTGSFQAVIDLLDAADAPPILHSARGTVALKRLLEILPPGLVPVRAREGWLRFDIAQLTLAALPHLAPGGHANAEATVSDLAFDSTASQLLLSQGRFALKAAQAADGALALQISAPLQGLRIDEKKQRQAVTTLALRDGEFNLQIGGLIVDQAKPLLSRGQFDLSGKASSLLFSQPGLRAELLGSGITARGRLSGHAPYAVEINLPVERLRLFGAQGRRLYDDPARLNAQLSEVFPDHEHPARSRAQAKLSVELGAARADVTANKSADGVTFDSSVTTSSLALLRAFVSTGSTKIPWEQIGLSLRSKGRIDHLESATPTVEHQTDLELRRPSFVHGDVASSAHLLTLHAQSKGTARQHAGELDLRAQDLKIDGHASGNGHLHAKLDVDLGAPRLRVRLGADAPAGPQARFDMALGFDRGRRAVSYDFDVTARRLSPLRPLADVVRALQGFHLNDLELGMRGRGMLGGLVDRVGPDGLPHFVPHPLATFGVDGTLELGAKNLRWSDGDRDVKTAALSWQAKLRTDGTRRFASGDLRFDKLQMAFGERQVEVAQVRDTVDLKVSGDLTRGEGELSHELKVGILRQNFLPGYSASDVTFSLTAKRSREGVLRLSALKLHNPAGGTLLNLRGGLDFGDERRSLSLRGTLDQDLSRVWNVREQFVGQGSASLKLRIESGNLSLFRVVSAVHIKDGTARLPKRQLGIESFDGEVPMTVDVILDRRGPRLLRDNVRNAYAELHFADQHPLLNRPSFISVARITTPLVNVGPVAGNLHIENNVVSLSQLEVGLLGGRLTGQSLINWGEKDAAIELHLRASNLHASTGERFDGNTAVVISARERSIDGRAEILRIGRRHLLDLLDLHDPRHIDPAVNRVRTALRFGYPDRVRLSFDHGFAAARITMGGLARLVRIDELRGIPMGPIIDRVIAQPASSETRSP